MSWQASQPSGPAEGQQPDWATGQGQKPAQPPAKETKQDAAPAAAAPQSTPKPEVAAKPSAAAPTEEVVKGKKEEKKDAAVAKRNSPSLLLMTMMIEGIAFGSLYGWAVQKGEGVSLPETRRVLGIASVLGPLLVIDRDCTENRISDADFGLLAIHMMLSLKSFFERSSRAFGPWSYEKIPADNLLAVVAFWTHLKLFLHLLIKESQTSFARKLALITSFALGSNLTVM